MIKKGIKNCIGILVIGISILVMEVHKSIMNIFQKITNWAFEMKVNCMGCGDEIEITDGIPFCPECKKNLDITISPEEYDDGDCGYDHPESFISKPVGKEPEMGYR